MSGCSVVSVIVGATLLVVAGCVLWPAPHRARRPSRGRGRGSPRSAVAPEATVEEASAALELVSVALRSGVGAVEALEAVAHLGASPAARDLAVVAAAHRWGERPDLAWARVGEGWAPAGAAWHASHGAGAAPAGLLADAAGRMRATELRRVERAVQRAGVLLVLPLGLCFLPGFIATTIVPVVLLLVGGFGR